MPRVISMWRKMPSRSPTIEACLFHLLQRANGLGFAYGHAALSSSLLVGPVDPHSTTASVDSTCGQPQSKTGDLRHGVGGPAVVACRCDRGRLPRSPLRPTTWRELAYLLLDLATSVVVFAVLVTLLTLGQGLLASCTRRRDPREREVLGLMASARTQGSPVITASAVEKHVGRIFEKLQLFGSSSDYRRVLAVLAYLREAG